MAANGKVLIADDDELVAELARTHLSGKGYEVLHAADGEATLKMAAADRPALIVLDVSMPGMDGMEVLRRMSADESLRGIPVIMLTARRYQEDVMVAIKLGARDYLAKPFTPEELLARVERVLNGTRA